jgi:hypothetical protein
MVAPKTPWMDDGWMDPPAGRQCQEDGARTRFLHSRRGPGVLNAVH